MSDKKEEPMPITDWLEANRNPEIDKQVEREAEELIKEQECCQEVSGGYLGTTCPKCNKPFRSVIQQLDMSKYIIGIDPYDEKETLEDFIKRESKSVNEYWFNQFQEQDKNKYSEEDLKEAFRVGFNVGYNDAESPSYLKFEEWFEQFKKK
jgi:hypothetical protein